MYVLLETFYVDDDISVYGVVMCWDLSPEAIRKSSRSVMDPPMAFRVDANKEALHESKSVETIPDGADLKGVRCVCVKVRSFAKR